MSWASSFWALPFRLAPVTVGSAHFNRTVRIIADKKVALPNATLRLWGVCGVIRDKTPG